MEFTQTVQVIIVIRIIIIEDGPIRVINNVTGGIVLLPNRAKWLPLWIAVLIRP